VYVYFVKTTVKPSMLKIGKASDVTRRIAELQTGCPYDLELLGTVRCKSDMHAMEVERRAHSAFKRDRVRHRGEWFRYTHRVELAVAEILRTQTANIHETARRVFSGRSLRDTAPKAEPERLQGDIDLDREFLRRVQDR
jgi:hypothetical protein